MSVRVLIGSLLAAMAVAGTDVSAGEFVEMESGGGAEPVRLIGYLARPSFDQLDLSRAPTRGITIKGHRVEYNEEATRNAIVRVRDFLQRTIGGQ